MAEITEGIATHSKNVPIANPSRMLGAWKENIAIILLIPKLFFTKA
jgi:hypothetical protein